MNFKENIINSMIDTTIDMQIAFMKDEAININIDNKKIEIYEKIIEGNLKSKIFKDELNKEINKINGLNESNDIDNKLLIEITDKLKNFNVAAGLLIKKELDKSKCEFNKVLNCNYN